MVKTRVMEDDDKNPFVVLMHGDLKVSTRELARIIGVKTIAPCNPDTANRHSGYVVGGTSPFGTREKMPVYMEETILELPRIYINGGKRGYLIGIAPREVARMLVPKMVKVGIVEGCPRDSGDTGFAITGLKRLPLTAYRSSTITPS